LERPYLFIEKIDAHRLLNTYGGKPGVEYTIINSGKTPAVFRSLSIRLQKNPSYPLRLPAWCSQQFYAVVEPGKRLSRANSADDSAKLDVEGSERGETYRGPLAQTIVLHGSMYYEGPSGALYHDRFCFRAAEDAQAFHPDGGDEYNSRETIADPADRRPDQE
jgi:hypothetical protein